MSGLDEKGRYCTCNSKTNPCVVCSKPKFIDPEWLKRKIEEEPDGMEVGAGFEIFSTPDTVATTPADVGELVERLGVDVSRLSRSARGDLHAIASDVREAATALEQVTRERDEWERRAGDAIMGEAAAIERAESAEAKLAEARKVIEPFAEVASEWDGEHESLHVFLEWNDDGGPVPSLPVAEFRAARRFLEETK